VSETSLTVHDTKVAVIVRSDLQTWQKLNVTAFLMSGIGAAYAEMIGQAYLDRDGRKFLALSVQPVIVLSADASLLSKVHQRAVSRDVPAAAFIEEMFSTSDDVANREVFSRFALEDAKLAGIAVRAERSVVDKITKGASLRH